MQEIPLEGYFQYFQLYYFYYEMRKYILFANPVLLVSLLLISCRGQLTNEKAERILIKAYKNNDHPEADGGRRTTISSLVIDSINQREDTALVFYRVNGIIENGSKYPKIFGGGEEEAHFKWIITGWKSE